jgi:hypothetical protein
VQRRLQTPVGEVPLWAALVAAVLLAAAVVVGFTNTPYLGAALLIIAALGVAAFLAWTRLPERYDEGPDKAELAAVERRQRQEAEEDEEDE